MVHKRDHDAVCAEPVVPAMDAVVSPARLPRRQWTTLVRDIVKLTGVADLWDDYAVGERIDHPGAMTLNDSDHSIATRLYQNTAKAHFNGFAMAAAGGDG